MKGTPKPELFHEAFRKFQECANAMDQLALRMTELIEAHKKYGDDPKFAAALGRILREAERLERVSTTGVRYSNIGGAKSAVRNNRPKDLANMLQMQRNDLALMRRQMHDTLDEFGKVLPLADKGEFASLILSGRHGFSDRIQQSVDMLGTYTTFYTRSCMTTIDATMQVYPSGLGWLREAPRRQEPGQEAGQQATVVAVGAALAGIALFARRR
ncbi:MAG: hypothetical protein AB7F50_06430 [Fimbriimonadaceae bacterium]